MEEGSKRLDISLIKSDQREGRAGTELKELEGADAMGEKLEN